MVGFAYLRKTDAGDLRPPEATGNDPHAVLPGGVGQ